MGSEKTTINIREYPINVYYSDTQEEGISYFANVDSHDKAPIGHKFTIWKLNGVSSAEFPEKFSLLISEGNAPFKKVNFVTFKKTSNNSCTLIISLHLSYQDWEMLESVASFVFRFSDTAKQELGILVTPEKDEYGYFVNCEFTQENTTNLFAWYSHCEHLLEKIYQQELVKYPQNKNQNYGEGKIHWWIRYVFVPLIGTGTIAAIIAKYAL